MNTIDKSFTILPDSGLVVPGLDHDQLESMGVPHTSFLLSELTNLDEDDLLRVKLFVLHTPFAKMTTARLAKTYENVKNEASENMDWLQTALNYRYQKARGRTAKPKSAPIKLTWNEDLSDDGLKAFLAVREELTVWTELAVFGKDRYEELLNLTRQLSHLTYAAGVEAGYAKRKGRGVRAA